MPSSQLHSWIYRWNQYVSERVSDHKKSNHQCHQKAPHLHKTSKSKPKDFTIIDRDSIILHCWAKEALHIHIKDPSLNRNIGKVRIPSVFNKLLKPHTQLEQPHSSIPHPKGHLLHLFFQHKRPLTLHTFLISIYSGGVIPMFTPVKCQEN